MNNYNQQQMNMMMNQIMNYIMNNFQNMNMMNNNMVGMGGNNMIDMFMMFQKWYQENSLLNSLPNSLPYSSNNNDGSGMNSIQYNNNININPYTVDQDPKGILEIGENYLKFKVDDYDIRNIKFSASSGLKVMISINKNKSLKKLFKEYAKRVGFPEYHLGKEIVFFFNSRAIDVNDDINTIKSMFPKDLITITVIELKEIKGANNQNKVKKN